MHESLESRVEELEKQVAELMKMKHRYDNEHIEKALRAALPATDAYHVNTGDEFVSRGVYCAYCWKSKNMLTLIDIGDHGIPRVSQSPLHRQCPQCGKSLEIQYVNL